MRLDQAGFISPPGMSHCILHSTYLSLVQQPLADRNPRLPFFSFGLGFFFFPSSAQAFVPRPLSSLDKTSKSFHSGFQSTRPSFTVASHLFPLNSRRTSKGLETCSWFLSSSSPLGFSSFFFALPSCDKLHSSHSHSFRSRPQLSAWDHTGLTFRLPFSPLFNFLLGP